MVRFTKSQRECKSTYSPKNENFVITYSTLVINRTNFIFTLNTNEDILMKVSNRRLGSTLTSIVGKLTKFCNKFSDEGVFFFSSTVPQLLSVLVCF